MLFGSLTGMWRAPAGDADARLDAVVVALGERVSVKRNERGAIVDVEVGAASPDKAERLARGLVDAFFAEQVGDRRSDCRRTIGVAQRPLRRAAPRTEEAERRAKEYREATRSLGDDRARPNSGSRTPTTRWSSPASSGPRSRPPMNRSGRRWPPPRADGEGAREALLSPVIERLRADQATLTRDEAYELSSSGRVIRVIWRTARN